MDKHLLKKFNKYVGREVKVTEIEYPEYSITENSLDDNDPIIAEFIEEAEEIGVILRPIVDGDCYTDDICGNRINASISKSSDGKWRISGLTQG